MTLSMAGALMATLLVSQWLSGQMIHWAHRLRVIDVPGPRSSHSTATPRGGGLAIVASFTIALLLGFYFLFSHQDGKPILVVAVGAIAVAAIGAWDDFKSLSAKRRLALHFLVAIGSVLAVPSPLVGSITSLSFVLSVLYQVWMINLFNFMDGIDGLAGGQAFTLGLSLGIMALLQQSPTLSFGYFCLAAAALGFLKFNWAPARIFMGDVGSGTLGFILATLGLWGERTQALPLPVTLIAMGVFVMDATWTLLVRGARKEHVTAAHRDHAYQHATQRGFSHATVSMTVLAINVLYLFPMAYQATKHPTQGTLLVFMSYVPLWLAACWLRAGFPLKREATPS